VFFGVFLGSPGTRKMTTYFDPHSDRDIQNSQSSESSASSQIAHESREEVSAPPTVSSTLFYFPELNILFFFAGSRNF
jgi:hypothetical protein